MTNHKRCRSLWLLVTLSGVLSVSGLTEFGYIPKSDSDITPYLKLALDVMEMRMAATDDEQRNIYQNGVHSNITLASLSLTAGETLKDVPIYSIYESAYTNLGVSKENDSAGLFDGAPVQQYADTIIQDLFELKIENIEATAAVIHHVLMSYWGQLWKIVQACKTNDASAMNQHLDSAVALWAGDGQIRGDNQKGYLMYHIAERAGAYFGQDDGESVVNSLVLETVLSVQSDIERGVCADTTGYTTVRNKVQLLMRFSNIALVQMLLHYIQEVIGGASSSDFVELFALAVTPQIAACDSGIYETLTTLEVSEDVTPESAAQAISAVQKSYSCLGITCADVGAYLGGNIQACQDPNPEDPTQLPPLANYRPSMDVRDISYIDRDIRQMRIFMELGRWSSAEDYYQYGWNSEFSLQDMATKALDWTNSQDFALFDNYYQGGTAKDYGHDLIQAALSGTAPFQTASDVERMGIVVGALQSMVIYMGVVGQLNAALTACGQSKGEQALLHWDGGAALLIGSAEGQLRGGQSDGQSLYALSKDLCIAFQTCEPDSSVIDTVLVASMQSGMAAIKVGVCEEARQIMQQKIHSALKIPIIQGLLSATVHASLMPQGGGAQGLLLAYTRALLPYVYDANQDSIVPLIANSDFFSSTADVEIDIGATFKAFRDSLPGMGIDCTEVGQLEVNGGRTGVCSSDAELRQPVASTPTSPTSSPSLGPVFVPKDHPDGLAWGRYNFTNENLAKSDSMFSIDVKNMWFSDTTQAAANIYLNASANVPNGLSGLPEVHSLQDFSTKASLFMRDDPMYNFFRVALFDDDTFDGSTSDGGWPYADSVEQLAIGPANGNSAQLGAKTVVVMEVWMMIAHKLYAAVRSCESQDGDPELIDSAVALWIGQEQGMGKQNSGWMMYAIAQEAAEFYGNPEREVRVNAKLMGEFVEAQELTKTCNQDTDSTASLRALVDDIVHDLSVPLLQHLLFAMTDENFRYVELFALAFIPQIVSVDEGSFAVLRDFLFQGFNWQQAETDPTLVRTLGKVLHAMRFTCEELGDTSTASESLKNFVTDICHQIELYQSNLLAAYETSSDVNELARIDLDVHQIDLFMRVQAYDLAFSVYSNGRNSRTSSRGSLALKTLATSELNKQAGELWNQYQDFYDDFEYFADEIISSAMPPKSRYSGYSRRQVSEFVRHALQTMIPYVQIVARLRSALHSCNQGGAGQKNVDEAVALYVGSIEGPFSGGESNGSGQMMYSLAKELCDKFVKCESHGDSEINVALLFAFADMKEALDAGNCDSAESSLEETILVTLPVPLIQGILYYADRNEGLTTQSQDIDLNQALDLSAGDILTETLLPQIDAVNETDAMILFNNMDHDPDKPAVGDGKGAVFMALTNVLPGMGVNCNTVGTLVSAGLSLCGASTGAIPPPPHTPTNLGDNLYVSTTYVQDRANIALDIKEMEEELSLGNPTSAENIYTDGKNSLVYDKQGKLVNVRSLAGFSTGASERMTNNPLYQIAVYALRDDNGKYLGKEATQYADTVVKDMFKAGSSSRTPFAAEAAVALNLWMEIANELFETVKNCKDGTLTDEDGVHSIDEAVAYWIGDGEIGGEAKQGHLLYALAEKMGKQFGINSSSQSRTNFNILRLFHQAKFELSIQNACTGNAATARRVRNIVNKITSQMVIVNIQALIHYLRKDNDSFRVKIYAHAFVPLVSACSPLAFQYLKERLLDAPYQELDVENIVAAIRSTFSCFSIKCDDVGIHSSEPESVCSDPSQLNPLADYRPANDIKEYSKLDLDILELDILMQMEAYEAAEELYSFGKHTSQGASGDGTAVSLESLATTSGRSVVPQFDAFRRYYDNNDNYADALIRKTFQNSKLSGTQKRTVVIGTSQYLILYMAALQAMYDAIGACTSSGSNRGGSASKNWDKAAALLIGQLEGSAEGGSTEGRLLWALSKDVCGEFGTCSAEEFGSSKTNDKIAMLLYSGRGAILGGSCDELRKATNELAPLLQIPLLQASLRSIRLLGQRNLKNKELVQAEAYIYAEALLPLIEDVDRNAAATIRANLPLEGSALRDGISAVFSAYTHSISGLGIKCRDVGASSEIDACSGMTNSSKKEKLLLAVFVILGVVTATGIFILLRSKLRQDDPENKPVFVVPSGELNHASDLLSTSRTEDPTNHKESEGETERLKESDCHGAVQDEQDDEEYVKAIEKALDHEQQDKEVQIV